MRMVALVLLLNACTGDDGPVHETHRWVSVERDYSLQVPDGWTFREERGSTVFTAPDGRKHSVVLRTAPIPHEIAEGRSTSKDDITKATQQVVQSLPSAHVQRRWTLDDSTLPAEAFSVDFQPSSTKQRYQRHHVVLIGSHRIYHLIHTAPTTEQVTASLVSHMAASLREDV